MILKDLFGSEKRERVTLPQLTSYLPCDYHRSPNALEIDLTPLSLMQSNSKKI